MSDDASNSANVRKKGRPQLYNAAFRAYLAREFPAYSWRKRYESLRIADVRLHLAEAVGESALNMGDGTQCRPLQFARWPWLLGHRIQYTVLLQLYGLPPEGVVEVADAIETKHREEGLNAKQMVRAAFTWKVLWFLENE